MVKAIFSVCMGGALGSLLRYSTGAWLTRYNQSGFPWATFSVNVVGCLLIGLFYALSEKFQWFSSDWKLFLIVGFCGGLTTFSAFAYENFKLLQEGNVLLFLVYTAGTFVTTLLAIVAGVYIARLW